MDALPPCGLLDRLRCLCGGDRLRIGGGGVNCRVMRENGGVSLETEEPDDDSCIG